MKKILISLFVLFITITFVIGCEESVKDLVGVENKNNPSVTYANSTDFSNTNIENYTNADWLFQNYFGEYGLPSELKKMMMPELKMVANGFALMYARGEDYVSEMTMLNTKMRQFYYSGMMRKSMSEWVGNHKNEDKVMREQRNMISSRNVVSKSLEPDKVNLKEGLTEEKLEKNQEEVRLEVEKQKQEQIDLVENNNLPYKIPERDNKVLILSKTMKNKSGGSGGSRPEKKFTTLNSKNWWDGDVIWSDGSGAGSITHHVGIINYIHDTESHVTDARPGDGVVIHRDINVWANRFKYKRVEGYYYPKYGKYHKNRERIVNHAESREGQKYNWAIWDYHNLYKAYCSQLVWQAYYWGTGFRIDLDDDGAWPTPDDVSRDSDKLMNRFFAERPR